jgi:hypothetical protein
MKGGARQKFQQFGERHPEQNRIWPSATYNAIKAG